MPVYATSYSGFPKGSNEYVYSVVSFYTFSVASLQTFKKKKSQN